MLSAIIEVSDGRDPRATFASLTAAATDGFVREVIVADPGGSADVAAIAEDAGARLVSDGELSFARACAEARHRWLLLLRSGSRLASGWERAAWRHINDHADCAGWFRLSLKRQGLAARAAEVRMDVAARLLGRLRAEHGLLISRPLYEQQQARGLPARLPLQARPLWRIQARILTEGVQP
jgi:hypothetical protein